MCFRSGICLTSNYKKRNPLRKSIVLQRKIIHTKIKFYFILIVFISLKGVINDEIILIIYHLCFISCAINLVKLKAILLIEGEKTGLGCFAIVTCMLCICVRTHNGQTL